jgi:hypothetical protein
MHLRKKESSMGLFLTMQCTVKLNKHQLSLG